MQRKLSWHLYIGALIITLLIFSLGFFVGGFVQSGFNDGMNDEMFDIQEKIRNIELLVISEDTNYFCEIYYDKIDQLDEDTYNLGQKLEFLESEKNVIDNDLKKQYFELELRDYILMNKAKEQCNFTMPVLIYFYTNTGTCPDCIDQGYEINSLRTEMYANGQMLRVYAYDGSMNDSAVVRSLMSEQGVVTLPSVVLINNGSILLEGLHSKDQMIVELGKLK